MFSSSDDDDLPDLRTLFPSLRGLSPAKTATKPPEDPSIADRISEQIHLATKFRLQNIEHDDLREKLKSIALESVIEKGSGEDSDARDSSSNSEDEPTSAERVFRMIDSLQFFGPKDAIPSVCGYSDQLTKFERCMLSLEVDELHAALPSLLMSCHPHCISDFKSFLTFLLRVISVSNDASTVLACQTCLVEMLNRHPLAKQARITSLELFPVLFNYRTDVKECPLIKQVCGLKSHLSKFGQIKTGPGREIPGNWTYNFEFLLKSVAKIVSTCLVEVEDLCNLVIFFMWISLDREVYSSSLYSVLQHCIASSVRRMPVTENPLEHAIDVAVTVSCIDFSGEEEKLSTLAALADSVPGSDKQCRQLKKVLAFFALNLVCSGTIDDMPCEFSLDELKLLLCRLRGITSDALLLTAAKLIDMCTCHLDPSAAKGLDSFCSDLQKFELSLTPTAFCAKSRLCETYARLRVFFRVTVGILQTFQKEKAHSPLSFKMRALSPVKDDESSLKTSRPRENELISSPTPEKGKLKRKTDFIDEGEESVPVKVAKRMSSDVSRTKTSITPISMTEVPPREQSPADIETLARTTKNIPESVKVRSTSHPSRNLEASSPSSCISFDSPGSEQRPFTALRTQSFRGDSSHARSTGHLPKISEGSSCFSPDSLNSTQRFYRYSSHAPSTGHLPRNPEASSPSSLASLNSTQSFYGDSSHARSTGHLPRNADVSSPFSLANLNSTQSLYGDSSHARSTDHLPRNPEASSPSSLASLNSTQTFYSRPSHSRSTGHLPKKAEGSSPSGRTSLNSLESQQRHLSVLEARGVDCNSTSTESTGHHPRNVEGKSASNFAISYSSGSQQRTPSTLNEQLFDDSSLIRMRLQPVVRACPAAGHSSSDLDSSRRGTVPTQVIAENPTVTCSTNHIREDGFVSFNSSQDGLDLPAPQQRPQSVVEARLPEVDKANISETGLPELLQLTNNPQGLNNRTGLTHESNCLVPKTVESNDSDFSTSLTQSPCDSIADINSNAPVESVHRSCHNPPVFYSSICRDLRENTLTETVSGVPRTVSTKTSDMTLVDYASSSDDYDSTDGIEVLEDTNEKRNVANSVPSLPVIESSIHHGALGFSSDDEEIVIVQNSELRDPKTRPSVPSSRSSPASSKRRYPRSIASVGNKGEHLSKRSTNPKVVESGKSFKAPSPKQQETFQPEVFVLDETEESENNDFTILEVISSKKGEHLSKRSTNPKVVESGKSFKSPSPKQQQTFQPEVFVLDETDDSDNNDFTILKEVISTKKMKEERTSSGTSYSFPLCSGLVALEIPAKGDVVKHSSKRSSKRKNTKKPDVDVITLDSDDDEDRSCHRRSSDSPTSVASTDRSSPMEEVQSLRRRPLNALLEVEAEEYEVSSDTEDAANKQSSGWGTSCLNPGVIVFEATNDEKNTSGAQPSRKRPPEDSTTIDGRLSETEEEASKQSLDRASRKESAGDSAFEAGDVAEKAYSSIRMFPMNSAVEDIFTADDVAGSSSLKLPNKQKPSYGFAVENASDDDEIVGVRPVPVQVSSQEPVEKISLLSQWIKNVLKR